jgi:paraquat-inducible protein A|nr:paraquat-inducible protein A [Kofleriaceae bacterium]
MTAHARALRARDLGLVACEACELVMTDPHRDTDDRLHCPRCGEPVHRRKVNTTARAWAFLIAALALYFPANVLVMMKTVQFPLRRADTIWSGVVFLWERGTWDLALIVLVASIVVPLVKLVALATLLVTTRRKSRFRPRARTRLYRVLETIGHWSMLDVFVVSLLTAVVQLGRFASVAPGPAVLPFAGVVVLTMLASASFDPRTIWDFDGQEPARG